MAKHRSDRTARPYPAKKLYKRGYRRVFRGGALDEIAFPLGGIGTGTVSLGGHGQLRDWEIFNRPSKGLYLPYSFFALWCRPEGKPPCARVLEARRRPPYAARFGLSPAQVHGLPRFARARFIGQYPFAAVQLDDPDLPLTVTLEAFNPFIPLNAEDSGLPVAILRYHVTNHSRRSIDVSIAASLLNVVGFDGRPPLGDRHHHLLGRNRNTFVAEPQGTVPVSPREQRSVGERERGVGEGERGRGGESRSQISPSPPPLVSPSASSADMATASLRGLRMTSDKPAEQDAGFGSMALAALHDGDLTYLTHWLRTGHWDAIQTFWDDFRDDGRLQGDDDATGSPDGQGEHASLAAAAPIGPGETRPFTFLIAWHFPNRTVDPNPGEMYAEPTGRCLRNEYATRFADAWSVARHVAEHLDRLERETRLYLDTFASSTLPAVVLDAAGSQASILRTNTCFRTDDGRLHAYEGCGDVMGCCPMNCTHVWNYEQTLAHLFPALERTMRDTDFGTNTRDDGNMAFRTILPLSDRLWDFKPAADGQMGCVLKLYREWRLSGDREFLARLWPGAQRALEFAWRPGSWDADGDGVMEGEQHNTYDIEFFGPNAMMGTLYLGALKAAALMARELGDTAAAEQYETLFNNGSEKLDRELFNGRWYEQTGVDVGTTKYQFGRGCLADQLLGQWFCDVVGLGRVLPAEHVRRALCSIFEHNWKRGLSTHHSVQRTYALNDEAGLLLCTWPDGGRPPIPFIYADEVWTGIEYQVAAHLIYEGFIDEGLSIVRGVRDRHDGRRRNPWNEFECGDHYARAMASWSLLLALSGFQYSAVEQSIAFAPRITPEKFNCFFSTPTAWGLFRQSVKKKAHRAELHVRYGTLNLRHLRLAWPLRIKAGRSLTLTAHLDGQPIDIATEPSPDALAVTFSEPQSIPASQRLVVELEMGR